MERVLATWCLLLLLAVGAAGCGGSERVAYERDLAKVGRIVDDALADLPQDQTATVGPEQVSKLADDLREASEQLADLDPPADARKPQAQLERGLRRIAAAFDDLAKDLAKATTDDEKADVFVAFITDERIDAAFEDVADAQDAYAKAGYRVFGSAVPTAPARTSAS